MAFFKSKSQDAPADAPAPAPGKPAGKPAKDTFARSPKKAEAFFRHAETTAEARNYDYAVELYVNGLRHQPDNMIRHEQLRDVAMRRKVSGGKPAGMMGVKALGPSTIDKMLTAEKKWSMDPLNRGLMLEMMEHAVDAEEQDDTGEHTLGEVAYWVGALCLESNASASDGKKPDPKTFLKLRELFRRIESYDKAVEACKHAIRLTPNDRNLLQELKDLEAEQYSHQSSTAAESEGGFRANIQGAEEQALQQAANSSQQSGDAFEKLVSARRTELEEDPQDLDKLAKLVDALLKKEANETEREAVKLLEQAYAQSGQYKFKVRAGDIKIRNSNRGLRALRLALKENPDNAELKAKHENAARKLLAFELKEFAERVEKYPTDLGLKFDLGKRQFLAGQVDDSITSFQQAKAEPRRKAQAHHFLGKAYLKKQWIDEAIETLAEGRDKHPRDDDALGKEIRYDLMTAYLAQAEKSRSADQAQEARKLASELLQIDINYRDIRQRVDQIRALVDELSG
ncbi:MAG: hypothetical protein AAGA57_04680 [Planctomycetota bacterium]